VLLPHSVDEAATRHPSHEAFRFSGSALTYEALATRAAQLANVLSRHGVRKGDRVGIYMTRGLELPVAVYGILKAGAAYVPIDPVSPIARAALVANDCGLRALVTNPGREVRAVSLASAVRGLAAVVGASSTDGVAPYDVIPWTEADRSDARPPDVSLAGHDLAYVMYTSGSTGAPKGLMHTHASGMAYVRLSARTYGVKPDDRLGNHSPLHFDMSTFEFLTGPWCGATTVIVPEDATMFPVSLGELIEHERLTFWYSVPLALVQLLTRGEIERRDCRTLRWVLFGGEPFPPAYLRRLMQLWPHARFSNVYGPAEVNQCTYYHVPRRGPKEDEPVPIGVVWDETEHLIVDGQDKTVRRGDAGELLVRSPTMMRGYWGRPDLDQTAFFAHESGGIRKTYYRTGDVVRERDEGVLMFLGRKDRQVKVRGYRVELDEVEHVLGAIAGVAEAAAFPVAGADGSMEIGAAVVPVQGATLAPETLRRSAADKLPPYALPQRIDIRPSLPKTATGKIDRRTLIEDWGSTGPKLDA
jgi:amino acid adenylation domain-containing protein